MCILSFRCRCVEGFGCDNQNKKVKRRMVFLSLYVSHVGVGFCKGFGVKLNPSKGLKSRMVIFLSPLSLMLPLFLSGYVPHPGVGVWKLLVVKINSIKNLKRHMVFMFFLGVSLRCRVPEGSGFENQLTKKKFKTSHGFHLVFCI